MADGEQTHFSTPELWQDIIRIQYEQNVSWQVARRVARASAFLQAKKARRLAELKQNQPDN